MEEGGQHAAYPLQTDKVWQSDVSARPQSSLTRLQDTSALLASDPTASLVLLGSAVDVSAPVLDAVGKLRRRAETLCAVLSRPFECEGARKTAAAAAALQAIGKLSDLLVVVDQEVLVKDVRTFQSSVELTDSSLCGAVRTVCHLMASVVVVGEEGAVPFLDLLLGGQQSLSLPSSTLLLRTRAAAFGQGQAAFAGGGDAAAAAAVTAAVLSAAATPFLADITKQERLAAVCLVECDGELPGPVLQAATQVLSQLLATDAPVAVAQARRVGGITVSLLFFSASLAAPRTVAHAPAASRPAGVSDAGTQRNWAALSKLAGGTARPPPLPVAAPALAPAATSPPQPLPTLPPPERTPVDRPLPPTPATLSPDDDALPEEEHAVDAREPPRGSLWRWPGASRSKELSVSARASAVLANDRAASRTVVRLEFSDGSTYEGEMRDGREEGTGRRVYANGAWYAGEFRNGLRHGWGVSQTGAERYEGLWEQGRPLRQEGDEAGDDLSRPD